MEKQPHPLTPYVLRWTSRVLTILSTLLLATIITQIVSDKVGSMFHLTMQVSLPIWTGMAILTIGENRLNILQRIVSVYTLIGTYTIATLASTFLSLSFPVFLAASTMTSLALFLIGFAMIYEKKLMDSLWYMLLSIVLGVALSEGSQFFFLSNT